MNSKRTMSVAKRNETQSHHVASRRVAADDQRCVKQVKASIHPRRHVHYNHTRPRKLHVPAAVQQTNQGNRCQKNTAGPELLCDWSTIFWGQIVSRRRNYILTHLFCRCYIEKLSSFIVLTLQLRGSWVRGNLQCGVEEVNRVKQVCDAIGAKKTIS